VRKRDIPRLKSEKSNRTPTYFLEYRMKERGGSLGGESLPVETNTSTTTATPITSIEEDTREPKQKTPFFI